MTESNALGRIAWRDLTVPDAEAIRDFYSAVVGWQAQPHDMGGYDDYVIFPPDSEDALTGISHARGSNAAIPPVWLIYITVADVSASAEQAVALGGTLLDGPRKMGEADFAVIQDPAGAVFALYAEAGA